MKKLIEVLIDDNNNLHFNSEMDTDWFKRIKNTKEYNKWMKRMIRAMVKCGWEDKRYEFYPAIRMLSMAEILAARQPYEQIEELWYVMINDTIPLYESYVNQLKIPYGFSPEELIKPIKMGDFGSIMNVDSIFKNGPIKN